MKPPLLPPERLRRVLRVARLDGTSILVVAGGFALISAAFRDVTGAVIGLLVAAAGAIELHGANLLRAADVKGMRWLVSSQLYLMAVMLTYVSFRLARPDIAALRPLVTQELADSIREADLNVDEVLLEMQRLVYFAVAAATLLYQGGMTLYYLRRRASVAAALQDDDSF
ncbi:MAG TPA: hypothetical protein VN775_04020 [Opitutaceae bacterium]|nr:hypothetical protein [Opitutaceae bacterium]